MLFTRAEVGLMPVRLQPGTQTTHSKFPSNPQQTYERSSPALPIVAFANATPRSAAVHEASVPPKRPMGVRTDAVR